MDNPISKDLLDRFNAGDCTEDEKAIVESWFSTLPDEQPIPSAEQIARAGEWVWSQLPIGHPRVRYLWPRLAAASVILLCLVSGGFFFMHHRQPVQVAAAVPKDIAPGRNQATLTLANGRRIVLRQGLTGQLAQQGKTVISIQGQKLTYKSGGREDAVSYNMLTTARGERSPFPLVLPDGTKVWLNALSSLRFPTAFMGADREVTVTGEAYFEVVHNAAKPFRVRVKDEVIEDVGTHFNVNAYDDEPALSTTLLEGKVRVSNGGSKVVLDPGECAVDGGKGLIAARANVQSAVAWKEGLFDFQDAGIPAVMRQLARWYDVEIQYEGAIPERHFTGEMEQGLTAAQVLRLLSYTNVHFRIEGKKIVVTP